MKVRAIRQGFFGGRRVRVGDEFECPKSAFSEKWMEEIKKTSKKEEKKVEEKKEEVTDFLHAETYSQITKEL